MTHRSLWLKAAACVLALAVAGGLAASLRTHPVRALDRYSAQHLMPGRPAVVAYYGVNRQGRPAVALVSAHPRLSRIAHFVWAPFSRVISSVAVLALAAYAALRRRQRARAIGWIVAFAAANFIAFLLQADLRRPEIIIPDHPTSYALQTYDASFPSGYAVRLAFLALVVTVLWPRLVAAVGSLAFLVLVAIVAGASHLLTDVIAGVALASGLYLVADLGSIAAADRLPFSFLRYGTRSPSVGDESDARARVSRRASGP